MMPISSTMVIRTRCHTNGAAFHDYRPGRLYGSAGPSRLRRYVDEWNAEPDSKAVGDAAVDAAVRVAAADPDFESLRRCSLDECNISTQSSGGRLGMPVVEHVLHKCY